MKNDRNAIFENYDNIVNALKEYGMWDELNSVENTRKSYKNVPYLLKNNDDVGRKLVTFMDTMLEEIEKKQFITKYQSIADILATSKKVWERDYAWLNIDILMDEDIVYNISEDVLQVIFDNLILNSVQQNDNTQKLGVIIETTETNGFLKIRYSDDGKGLDDKYKENPKKILEVHETTRINGHGLGMWIVNNTCIMSGGEIIKIEGEGGFAIEFTIGGKM
jgi:signal transduction histidine kinase